MKFPEVGGGRSGGGSSGGLFLELTDGSKYNGVLRGDPKIYRVHWDQGQNRYIPCAGKDGCALCDEGDDAKTRAKFNFVLKEDGVWVAKILDVSIRTFIDLKELQEGGYDLEETPIQITQKGVKTKKRITVLPLKNGGGLKPSDFKAIASVPLNPLKGEQETETRATEKETEPAFTEDDIPF